MLVCADRVADAKRGGAPQNPNPDGVVSVHNRSANHFEERRNGAFRLMGRSVVLYPHRTTFSRRKFVGAAMTLGREEPALSAVERAPRVPSKARTNAAKRWKNLLRLHTAVPPSPSHKKWEPAARLPYHCGCLRISSCLWRGSAFSSFPSLGMPLSWKLLLPGRFMSDGHTADQLHPH